MATIRQLAPGYAAEVDRVDEARWYDLLQRFNDANIYQTWAYSAVRHGRRNTSHLLLKKDGEIVAIVQASVKRIPVLRAGIAHVRWGPLWQLRGREADTKTFRQAVRALRNEYVCRRGLVLRFVPNLYVQEGPFAQILAEEGLDFCGAETRSATILMDITPEPAVLREGMKAHWKRELKVAERKGLETSAGRDDAIFAEFLKIYREMVRRKKFTEGNDVDEFRRMQAQLPDALKMDIMLCSMDGTVAAGSIWSAMGNSALYLFGATGDAGAKSNGSYLLQWKLIEQAREHGCVIYDLNGINAAGNPGTYKFKDDLAGKHGRHVVFLGRFEAKPAGLSALCVEVGERARSLRDAAQQYFKGLREGKDRLRSASSSN